METQPLNQNVQKRIAERDRVVSAMDAARVEIVHCTCEFLTQWNAEQVQRARSSYPDAIKKLASEKLRELKDKLAELDRSVEDLVTKSLNDKALWVHQTVDDNPGGDSYQAYQTGTKINELYDGKCRHLLGRVGGIMQSFGIGETRHGYVNTWDTTSAGTRFNSGYEKPGPLKEALKKYTDLNGELMLACANLKVARHDLAKAEADDAWDKA